MNLETCFVSCKLEIGRLQYDDQPNYYDETKCITPHTNV